jgi:hypothetical protein
MMMIHHCYVDSLAQLLHKITYKQCHDFSLELATKAKGMESWRPKVQLGSPIHTPKNVGKCEGMNPHTPKWVPILGVGVSMDIRIFKKQFEGVKTH